MIPEDVDPEVWQQQLEESYRGIKNSVAYLDILGYINATREAALTDAESSLDVNNSYGLLKSAQACKTIREYIERMTTG